MLCTGLSLGSLRPLRLIRENTQEFTSHIIDLYEELHRLYSAWNNQLCSGAGFVSVVDNYYDSHPKYHQHLISGFASQTFNSEPETDF